MCVLCVVCPVNLAQLRLTSFVGFGKGKEAKSLRQCSIYATVKGIWLECNSYIFNERFSDKYVL